MLVIGVEEEIVTQYVEAYVDWHGIVQDWLGTDKNVVTSRSLRLLCILFVRPLVN